MDSGTCRSECALARRSREINSVAEVFEGLPHKYDVSLDDLVSGDNDPNLAIEEIINKSQILENLQCHLLPSVKGQITSLLTSLDLQHDSQGTHPDPDVESTLGILSDLELTMTSTLSSIKILARRSNLPDNQHDHHLQNLKRYRCARLDLYIAGIIKPTINSLLLCCGGFMRCCGLALADLASVREEVLGLTSSIRRITAAACGLIDATIAFFRKSDWALIQEGWLMAEQVFDVQLEHLTSLVDLPRDSEPELALRIIPSEEPDLIERTSMETRRKATREQMMEIARSTISLVKLGRILAKKLSKMIPPIFAQDSLMNSETLEQFHDLFGPIGEPLKILTSHLRYFEEIDQTITSVDRDQIDTLVTSLSENMKSTMTFLASHLIFFEDTDDTVSPESDHFMAWSGTLEELWNKVVDRLLEIIRSLEVEPEHQIAQAA
ncbi:hypothetical protein Pst134EA_027713 [Puccinia striiformis f. sp. tritici]|uniref:hypothetical protein n=1 Tax=Puccinia striiformis f. sp. tritici TaxID=168172 RepID=UPI0020079BFE|nr:hypothetical protein Pst134EA_027713 [Puccinia striiformis f. sp. tritici]KAH9448401.1 hypothetical protein Pst134EA_027713 [Puccinia striiformis f. sp. tritici]KAI9625225.1 hypothetical protein H4Q26_016416 [Puccinia striiformis f. sp. tritici PST-130]